MEKRFTGRLVLIIPFFNEAERIPVRVFEMAFKKYQEVDFLLVDDKSLDATPRILRDFAEQFSNVHLLLHHQNMGKAESIRSGVKKIGKDYDFIGYLDADLAAPFDELMKLFNYTKTFTEKKFIMGTRIKLLGNNVKRSLKRHYFGRVFATVISQFILRIPVYDTQCGAKIIDADLAERLFEKPFYTKWLFDVELLLRFREFDNDFAQKCVEIPLETWTEKGDSKIEWFEFLKAPFQILKLYAKYH